MFAIARNEPDIAYISLLTALAEDEAARQKAVITARDYHAGRQLVKLTDRLQDFLGSDADSLRLRLNICRTVVQAVIERLTVTGLEASAPTDAAMQAARAWAGAIWQRNQMDARQDAVHEMAIRDGEGFLVVVWDVAERAIDLYPQPRYTSAEIAGGENYGCKAFYENGDPDQRLLYVTKQWVEQYRNDEGRIVNRRRLTIYYPDRIEKYAYGKGWERYQDAADQGWPLPWVDTAKQPLGIPVVHFRNYGEACEAWEAIPLQKAINKALVDLLAASDLTAFQVLVAFGWQPVDANNDPLPINPGQIIGTTNADGSMMVVPPADISGLMLLVQNLVQWAAMVTDTPLSRFQVTGQIAAEGTLKQQQAPLIAKVEKRQVILGNAWEQVFAIAKRLHNAFGGTVDQPAPVDEQAVISVQWAPAAPRSEQEVREDLAFKRDMGVPTPALWREMGYSEAEIKAFEAMKAAAVALFAPAAGQNGGNNV